MTYRVLPSHHAEKLSLPCISMTKSHWFQIGFREFVISLVKILRREEILVFRVCSGNRSAPSDFHSHSAKLFIGRSHANYLSMEKCVCEMSLSLRFCTIIRLRSERSCFFEIFEFIAVLLYHVSLIQHVRWFVISIYSILKLEIYRIYSNKISNI